MSPPHAVAAARAALAAELAPAQADAERRFGADPPPVWQPTWSREATTMRPRTAVWIVGALALLAAGAALVWRNPMTPTAPLPTPAQVVADAADPVPVEAPDDVVLDTADESPPATSGFTLTREGTGWRIAAAGASRLVAAQRLAQFGAGTLHGDLGLLARGRPLDLRWQGRRLADAWPAVLGGGEASYALQCGRVRCAVWLIAAGTPATVARDAYAPGPVVPAARTEPVTAASPSDSADPRVASHHD